MDPTMATAATATGIAPLPAPTAMAIVMAALPNDAVTIGLTVTWAIIGGGASNRVAGRTQVCVQRIQQLFEVTTVDPLTLLPTVSETGSRVDLH